MFKKIFPLLLLSILFIGCTTDVEVENEKIESTISNKISSSISTTSSIKDILINDSVKYSSKYSFLETLTVFPDPNNNNKLSISDLEELNSFISSESIISFHDYSILNTVNVDDLIYFGSNTLNNSGIFKFNYEKNSFEKISDYIPISLTYQNGFLYFISNSDNFIYSLDLKTNSVELLSNNKTKSFLISNNFIVYQNISDNSKLYALKTDNTHKIKLTDVPVDSFIALNKEILFFDSSNNNILSSLNLQTETITRYNNVIGHNLKTDSNNIYFLSYDSPNKLYTLNREDLTYELLSDDFINDYYPADNKVFLEMAVSLDKVYILDLDN